MHAWWPLVKTIIFTVLVPGTVTIILPYLFLTNQIISPRCPSLNNPFSYLAICGIVMGAAVSLKCAWDFALKGRGTPSPVDPPKELLVRGPYRYMRNPMYTGIILILFGEALLFCSRHLLLYGIVMLAAFHLFVILYEEPALTKKFGDSYQNYCQDVPRWLPKFSIRAKGIRG